MEENEKMYLDWDGLQEYHQNIESELSQKVNSSDLANVATSGDYSDLNNTPTNVSQFTNDAGYLTSEIDNTNGHEYVEIGGLKWATMNIGATNITDIGLYFQWGDILGYTSEEVGVEKNFTWNDYKFNPSGDGETFTKYNSSDEKISLDLEDDPVASAWGSDWRTPTSADFQAFSEVVDTEWVSDYQDSGVSGLLCTDKEDSTKTIFFPAGGFCSQGSIINEGGLYWTKSLANSKDKGIGIGFDDSNTSWNLTYNRCLGYCLRGILNGPNKRTVMGVTQAEKNTWNNKIENITYANKTFVKTTNGINSNIVTTNTLKTDLELEKSDVGLGNVTNDSQVKRSEMGTANGVATLDENGKILSNQLPSYVDDVIEAYYHGEEDPETGEIIYNMYEDPEYTIIITPESGKIYMDVIENITYRWGGSTYVPILGGVTLGETSSTAYRGDRGKIAYDHSQLISGNPHGVTKSDVGLGNVGNFKAVSTEASQILTDTEKENARNNIGAGTYSLPSGGIPSTDLATSYLPLTGGTLTGDLYTEANIYLTKGGSSENRTFSFERTNNNSNIDFGWNYANRDGAMCAFRSVDDTSDPGSFILIARDGTDSISLKGQPDGTFSWGSLLSISNVGAVTTSNLILVDRTSYGALTLGTQLNIMSARSKNAGTGTYAWTGVISTFGSGETGTTVNNFPVRLGSQSGATWISAGESGKTFSSVATGMCNTENLYLTADGGLEIYTGLSNDSTNYASKLAMTIDTSCNVGIGTSNPTYKLHVNGSTGMDSITTTPSTTDGRYMTISSSGIQVRVPSSNGWAEGLGFYTNQEDNNLGMFAGWGTGDTLHWLYAGTSYENPWETFFPNGSFSVNNGTMTSSKAIVATADYSGKCTTGAGTKAKAVAIDGYSLASGKVIRILFTKGNSVASATLNISSTGAKTLRYNGANVTATTFPNANTVLLLQYDGTYYQILSINGASGQSNNLYVVGTVGATNFYTTSDRSKKENIEQYSEHISKFTLKETGRDAYGVIAQDVPEMFRDGEEGSYTVNYNSILSYYVGTLENKVKMLEERLEKLEKGGK